MAKTYKGKSFGEMTILIHNLRKGDQIKINDWKEWFTVAGESMHYVVAFQKQEYTIIPKDPMKKGYNYNGIVEGQYICCADDWVFGWPDAKKGYDFSDDTFTMGYLNSLESGDTGLSMRRREAIQVLYTKPKDETTVNETA